MICYFYFLFFSLIQTIKILLHQQKERSTFTKTPKHPILHPHPHHPQTTTVLQHTSSPTITDTDTTSASTYPQHSDMCVGSIYKRKSRPSQIWWCCESVSSSVASRQPRNKPSTDRIVRKNYFQCFRSNRGRGHGVAGWWGRSAPGGGYFAPEVGARWRGGFRVSRSGCWGMIKSRW